MGRKRTEEMTPKQQEVLEIYVRHIAEWCCQPSIAEVAEMLGVNPPAIRDRLAQIVEKGLMEAPPHRFERCFTFPNMKMIPYAVDDRGDPIPEQEIRIGNYIVRFEKAV